jgi:hypothetical protein
VMGVQGLTIYHVKSHLQKYRLAKYLPDSSSEGKKTDKKESGDMLSGLDGSSYVKFPSLSLICDAIYILPRAAD